MLRITVIFYLSMTAFTSFSFAMDSQFAYDNQHNLGCYPTIFEEGHGSMLRFFSGRKNSFSLDDERMEPQELLAMILINPDEEQGRQTPFSTIKEYYQGVQRALEETCREKVPENKRTLYDSLKEMCPIILGIDSYAELAIVIAKHKWESAFLELANLILSCSLDQDDAENDEESLTARELMKAIDGSDLHIFNTLALLDEALGIGNVTENDIASLLTVALKLLEKTSWKSIPQKDLLEVHKLLIKFCTKAKLLKESQELLYLGTHEQCEYTNDVDEAARSFAHCLNVKQLLSLGKPLIQEDFTHINTCLSFFRGIHRGLELQPETLGRKYAITKLTVILGIILTSEQISACKALLKEESLGHLMLNRFATLAAEINHI